MFREHVGGLETKEKKKRPEQQSEKFGIKKNNWDQHETAGAINTPVWRPPSVPRSLPEQKSMVRFNIQGGRSLDCSDWKSSIFCPVCSPPHRAPHPLILPFSNLDSAPTVRNPRVSMNLTLENSALGRCTLGSRVSYIWIGFTNRISWISLFQELMYVCSGETKYCFITCISMLFLYSEKKYS